MQNIIVSVNENKDNPIINIDLRNDIQINMSVYQAKNLYYDLQFVLTDLKELED